jgi:hypothetical protein
MSTGGGGVAFLQPAQAIATRHTHNQADFIARSSGYGFTHMCTDVLQVCGCTQSLFVTQPTHTP